MKVYLLHEADFERLRLRLVELHHRHQTEAKDQFGEPVMGFRSVNCVVETWISEVQSK